MCPYNPNIPQPNDRIKDSQPEILDNFQAIQTVVAVNHVTFDDPSGDQGKHRQVTFPQLPFASNPIPTTVGNDITLYSKALAGSPQLYVQRSAGTDVPFTAATLVGGLGSTGYTSLASGILLKWGVGAAAPNGVANVVFDATVPFTQVYVVLVSPRDFAGGTATFSVSSGSITNVGCTLIYSGSGPNPINIQYLAIGRGT